MLDMWRGIVRWVHQHDAVNIIIFAAELIRTVSSCLFSAHAEWLWYHHDAFNIIMMPREPL